MRFLLGFLTLAALLVGLLVYALAQTTTGNNAPPGCSSGSQSCANGGGPKVVGNGSYSCTQANGHNGQKFSSGGCTSTSATPPPPPEEYIYFNAFGENASTTPTQQSQYMNSLCEGSEAATTGGATIFGCVGQGQYWSLNMGQSTLAGHDTSMPFIAGETGTGCTEPAGSNFWASSIPNFTTSNPSLNWGVWPTGTTVGSFAGGSDIALATFSGTPTTYTQVMIFLNLGSSDLLTYGNNTFQNCGDHNNYSFARNDNVPVPVQSNGWTIYGNHVPPAYITLKNIGQQSGGPNYLSADCNGGGSASFNGSRCTRSTQVNASATSTLTWANDAAEQAAYCTAFNAFTHKNGTALKFMVNGAFSTDPTILNCTNVFATQAEQYIAGHCAGTDTVGGTGNNIFNPCEAGLWGHTTSFSPDNLATVIDWCATTVANDPGKQNMVEDFEPNSGNYVQGTALQQWIMRAHWGALWSCTNNTYPNMMISFAYFGDGTTGDIGVFSPDFVEPYGRYTPYPQQPTGSAGQTPCAANSFGNDAGTGVLCTINGISDPNICVQGSGNACVVVTEFQHTAWQQSPNLANWPGSKTYGGTSTVSDLGKSCLIDNNTTAGVQITQTVINSWCKNTASSLAFVAADCTPNGYFNTSGTGTIYAMPTSGGGSVCSGTSGESVNQGGAFDTTQALSGILNEYLPPGDTLFLVQS